MYKKAFCRVGMAALPSLVLVTSLFSKAATATYSNSSFREVARYTNQRYDYEVIGNTMSTGEDKFSCGKKHESSGSFSIADEAKVVKAVLYWAGSGHPDSHVKLNGNSVYGQKYYTAKVPFLNTFGVSADVTSIVKGGGEYTVSSLDWDNSYFTCLTNGAFGAWQLVVVYEDEKFPKRNIVWHDGFEYTLTYLGHPRSIKVSVPNIVAPACKADGVATVSSWEGDSFKPEHLTINGVQQTRDEDRLEGFSNTFSQRTFNLDIDTYLVNFASRNTFDVGLQAYWAHTKYGYTVEGAALNAVIVRTNGSDACQSPDPDSDPDDK